MHQLHQIEIRHARTNEQKYEVGSAISIKHQRKQKNKLGIRYWLCIPSHSFVHPEMTEVVETTIEVQTLTK